ncbi:MAG: polysaccharide deacetylase family protein [Methylobacter sp.]|nr:polysaccharide deacetylase family protein [Methylobacter sp.]
MHIPILMYHSISHNLDDHLHPYYRTVTTPERFEQQMHFLSHSGYQVLTLSQAVLLSQEASELPLSFDSQRPKVVITFDDGLRDFYTSAFPILEKFGFKANVFLTSGLIDRTFITGRECLKAQEIKELAEKGIEFGSHTVSHPQLKALSRNEIVHELAISKQMIEDIIGFPVALFSYPYRFPEEAPIFTKMFGMLLVDQGYSIGVTTIIGITKIKDNPLFLKRLPINDWDDPHFFQAKLEGAYDWLHTVQLIYKKFRSMFHAQKASVAKNSLNVRNL